MTEMSQPRSQPWHTSGRRRICARWCLSLQWPQRKLQVTSNRKGQRL